jgi:glycosyltransferase involved in cell wall biosynthesis
VRSTPLKIAVVVAAYDEAGNIEELTDRLLSTLHGMPGTAFELIYVVEGSDGTAGVVRRLAARCLEIKLIEPTVARGLGAAFRLGFAAVDPKSDVVVTMDADLNHQPEEIPALVAALENLGADIVIGSRRVPGSRENEGAKWRAWLSRFGNWGLHRCFPSRVRDLTSGFRVYRAPVLARIAFASDGFAFLPEIALIAARANYRVVEVPIRFTPRRSGQSKLRLGATSVSYLSFLRAYWTSMREGRP